MMIILAPESRIDKNIRCTVIAAGKLLCPGGNKVPSDLNPGDVVVLRQWSGDIIDNMTDDQVLNVQYGLIEAVDKGANPDPKAMEYIKQFNESKILDMDKDLKIGKTK